MALFIFAIRACVGSGDGAKTAAQQQVQPAGFTGRPERISAELLWLAYKGAEMKASQRFDGRRVLVTGEIKSANEAAGFVRLVVSDPDRCVHARKVRGDVGSLREGQVTALECTARGRMFGDVVLDDCMIASSAPDPAPPKTDAPEIVYTESLWQAYQGADSDTAIQRAANEKYYGLRMAVVGKVKKAGRSKVRLAVPVPSGYLEAEVRKQERGRIALSPGDEVTMECTGRGQVAGIPLLGDCVVR